MPTAGPINAMRSFAATSGSPGPGSAGRDVADDGDPAVLQVEDADDCCCAEHADQGRRRPGEEVAEREQHGQRGQTERRGRAVQLVEVPEHLAHLAEERRGVLLDAEQLAELRGSHDEGDAGEVAHEHRPRQQVGERAEPQHPADHAARRDHQRQCRRQRHPVVAGGHQRAERGGRHQRRRRLRADRELARRAQDDVHGQAADHRPQRCLGWDAGHLGVRHHLRDQVRRHGDAREQVAAQPAALVAADPPGSSSAAEVSGREIRAGAPLRPLEVSRRATRRPSIGACLETTDRWSGRCRLWRGTDGPRAFRARLLP